MVGILVFTSKEVLNHKLKDGLEAEGNYCYWTISREPKQEIDKIYFAIKGQVKGYFDCHMAVGELRFFSEDWHEIKNGEILKASQGWRYYDE